MKTTRIKPLKPRGVRGKRLQAGDNAISKLSQEATQCALRHLVPKVICVGGITPHHVTKRTVSATRHDEKNILFVCVSHHNFIETHKAIARKMGWVVDSKSKLLECSPIETDGTPPLTW